MAWGWKCVLHTFVIWVFSVFALEEECPEVFGWDVDLRVIGGDGHYCGE
jgi:hypothetical protein